MCLIVWFTTAPNGLKAKDIHTKQKQGLKERKEFESCHFQIPSTQKLIPDFP